MSNLVIVAIPAEDDVVHQISSEKVPHLTLMYLGEASDDKNVTRMAEFVEHALSLNGHGPFWLEVDYRGEFGEDKADVVFFEGGWEAKWIKSLRGQLLQQSDIRAAYQSEDQFPDWVPHLTLGYPDAPAKPFPKDYSERLYSVRFDRIAVWDGNYEGPEFRLKREEDQLTETHGSTWDGPFSLHSAEFDEEALAHFGVKGMRWGVRKTEDSAGGALKTAGQKIKGAAKAVGRGLMAIGASLADSSWQSSTYSDVKHEEVHNKVAKELDNRVDRLQRSPKYNGKDLKANADLRKEYYQDVAKVTNASYRRAVKDTYGENFTSTKSAHYVTDARGARIEVRDKKTNEVVSEAPLTSKKEIARRRAESSAAHAATDEAPDLTIELVVDDNQQITGVGFVQPSEEAEHAILELGSDFLKHYGVKGMRWGVRKDDSGSGTTTGPKKEAVKRGVKKLVDFSGDIQFENMAMDGRARQLIVQDGKKNFKKEDLPVLREKHGDAAKLKNRLLSPVHPETKAYRKDAREAYIKQLEASANKMTNYSGDRQFTIRERGIELPPQGGDLPKSRYFWDVTTRKIEHAMGGFDGTTTVELILDEVGFITDLVVQDSAAAHSATLDLEGSTQMIGAAFLEHYGIKGMRWGRRKEEPEAVKPEANSRVPHGDKRLTKIDVKGGENHPATPDALKVAQVKAKYQKSGPAALNNQELRELQERMNLEANVSRLVAPASKIEQGRRFVKSFTSANKEFNDTARTSMETVRLVKQATA